MSDKQNTPAANRSATVETDVKSGKAAYSVPVLRVYGSVGQLTQGGGGSLGDGTVMDMVPSDPLIKEHIVRVDTHPLGIGLYLFDYKPAYRERCGTGRQFGVMADEVESVAPAAVAVHPEGYKVVNYAMLGITHRLQ